MIILIKSNVIQPCVQLLRHNLLLPQNLSTEFRCLLGILQHCWYLDGPCPVDIVECLCEKYLVQHSLLDFWVRVHYFVMIGNCSASLWSLRHNVEIIVSDNLLWDECACRWIVDFAIDCEKSFYCFNIDQSQRDCDIATCIDFFDWFHDWLNKELM